MNVGGDCFLVQFYGDTPGATPVVYDWQFLVPALLAYNNKETLIA